MKKLKPKLIPATLNDYPIIQNMARFYVYDRSHFMKWECPGDGMFECIDFKHYFEAPSKKAFLIKVEDELAGFVLLDQTALIDPVDWNMGEFYILSKFQGQGISDQVMYQIFNDFIGKWSIAVMPENIKALKFWRKILTEVSAGKYDEVFKTEKELKIDQNIDVHSMIIFTFKIEERNQFLNSKYSINRQLPKNKSALEKLIDLENNARAFGFDWTDEAMIIDQVIDECREIKEAIEHKESQNRIQEEIGDLIHSAISLCLFSGFDVKKTIEKINQKFDARMGEVEKLTYEAGLEHLQGQSMDFMLDLWREAKTQIKESTRSTKSEPDKHDPIELVPYHSEWPIMAASEIALIRDQFPKRHIIDIQHIGSTAISNIRSKPIIDIQIAVDSLVAIKEIAIDVLQKLGYVFWLENPDPERMFFVKGMLPFWKKRTHHVHIVESSSKHWKQKILFRNYLLSHPEAVQQYEELKEELLKQHMYDRETYTESKSEFVHSILVKAEKEISSKKMTDEGKKYDLIASGFANMRDSFNKRKNI